MLLCWCGLGESCTRLKKEHTCAWHEHNNYMRMPYIKQIAVHSLIMLSTIWCVYPLQIWWWTKPNIVRFQVLRFIFNVSKSIAYPLNTRFCLKQERSFAKPVKFNLYMNNNMWKQRLCNTINLYQATNAWQISKFTTVLIIWLQDMFVSYPDRECSNSAYCWSEQRCNTRWQFLLSLRMHTQTRTNSCNIRLSA